VWGKTDTENIINILPDSLFEELPSDWHYQLFDTVVISNQSENKPVPSMKGLLLSIREKELHYSNSNQSQSNSSSNVAGLTILGFALALVTISFQVSYKCE
jgi:hypothetical protein